MSFCPFFMNQIGGKTMKPKTRQRIAGIIAVILIIGMILPLVLSAMY
jgi:hypothetical protein